MIIVIFSSQAVVCPLAERREKDIGDVDHDAIAHRLREDVV